MEVQGISVPFFGLSQADVPDCQKIQNLIREKTIRKHAAFLDYTAQDGI
ncbi:hypothetical protein GCWU000341_02096 [Oribacterium sp. oral taxon 078 str. F0262]|jgi:hypothetical protein|nr:hypothetical protein GCWU000341_02096 [Oribacterium sp. oral taxon 078 str. F0262]